MPQFHKTPSSGNVCIRCGKPRVFKDSWSEKMSGAQGETTVTHSQFVCPDDDCQKKVERELLQRQVAMKERQDAQDKRELERTLARSQAAKKN